MKKPINPPITDGYKNSINTRLGKLQELQSIEIRKRKGEQYTITKKLNVTPQQFRTMLSTILFDYKHDNTTIRRAITKICNMVDMEVEIARTKNKS